MSMNWLSTLPAAGCVDFAGRRAYPFSASGWREIQHTPGTWSARPSCFGYGGHSSTSPRTITRRSYCTQKLVTQSPIGVPSAMELMTGDIPAWSGGMPNSNEETFWPPTVIASVNMISLAAALSTWIW